MSIGINGVGRVTAASPDARAPGSDTPTVRPGTAVAVVPEIDAVTQLPIPPRFPWLSRLAAQLEPAAKQKPPFPSAPQIGENLDQAV